MGYDLLRVPDGYKTDLALIIAPYFDPSFAHQLIAKLKPRRLRFLLDDGSSKEEVQNLRDACGRRDVKIALGGAPGIVHIKGFYLNFIKSEAPAIQKNLFLFGSPNATEAAFGGKINAELFACVDLSDNQDKELLKYLNFVLTAVNCEGGIIKGVSAHTLGHRPTLRLPSFKIEAVGPASGFDTWLQRGRLVAKYRDAQSFMTVAIKLRKNLPQGLIARVMTNNGLMQQGPRNLVRYGYVGVVDDDRDSDDNMPNWYSQLCIWTRLGGWVSEECFKERETVMRSNAAANRDARIKELLENGEKRQWQSERREALLATLRQVWKSLSDIPRKPSDYLLSKNRGNAVVLDFNHYIGLFNAKLRSHLALARNDEFRSRYVRGYEFPKVPKFRQDTADWEAFVLSWCQSIVAEAAKKRLQSLGTKAIKYVLEERDDELSELEADDIKAMLRTEWDNFGDALTVYFDRNGRIG